MRMAAAGADRIRAVIVCSFVPVIKVMSTCVFMHVMMMLVTAGGVVVRITIMRMNMVGSVFMDMCRRKAVHWLRGGDTGGDEA